MDSKSTSRGQTKSLKKLEFALNFLVPCQERKDRIQSQIQEKLRESQEYHLTLGLGQSAEPLGLSSQEVDRAFVTVQEIAQGINAEASMLEKVDNPEGVTGHILLRNIQKNLNDIRIALIGESQVGKSTLVGVLSKGVRENGKGSARNAILLHKHEKKQGITASVSQHSVHFDSQGKILKPSKKPSQLIQSSSKIITLIDLPGLDKFKSTLLNGLISQSPDYAALMIDPSTFNPSTNQEYLNLLAALNIPYFIILSKCEKVSNKSLDSVLDFLTSELSKHNKMLIEVQSYSDALLMSKTFVSEKIVPVFSFSLKTHKNSDFFVQFLNLLTFVNSWDPLSATEFYVDKCYQKEKGTVLCGLLKKGIIRVGKQLLLGPDNAGNFQSIVVRDIRVMEVERIEAYAGQFCSLLATEVVEPRKGMVLVDSEKLANTVYEFECWMWTIDSGLERTLNHSYKPLIFMQNSSQCTCIVAGPKIVSSREPMKFRLRFLYRPEFLEMGSRIMVKDNFMTAVGTVSCLKY